MRCTSPPHVPHCFCTIFLGAFIQELAPANGPIDRSHVPWTLILSIQHQPLRMCRRARSRFTRPRCLDRPMYPLCNTLQIPHCTVEEGTAMLKEALSRCRRCPSLARQLRALRDILAHLLGSCWMSASGRLEGHSWVLRRMSYGWNALSAPRSPSPTPHIHTHTRTRTRTRTRTHAHTHTCTHAHTHTHTHTHCSDLTWTNKQIIQSTWHWTLVCFMVTCPPLRNARGRKVRNRHHKF